MNFGPQSLTATAAVMLAIAACSAPQERASTCEDPPIKGSRSSLTLVNTDLNGIHVGEPVSCDGNPDVYVPLQGQGWRTIVMGRGAIKGYAGCSPEDAVAGPDDACPTIQFDLFTRLLAERVAARGGIQGGSGLGACGDINGGYDGWNASYAVLDWSHADMAIEEAARLMEELQIGNRFGITVTHPVCGIALEAHD